MIPRPQHLADLRLADLVARASDLYPDNEAIVDGDRRLTWSELEHAVDATARAFVERGIAAGDRVALWLGNSADWVVVYYALARIGAVVVPVNTRLRPAEVAYIVEHAQCEWGIIGDALSGVDQLDLIAAVRAETKGLPRHLASTVDRDDVALNLSAVPAAAAAADDAMYRRRVDAVDPSDLAILLYTSGTTGFPKGVTHTHRVIRNMFDLAERMEYTSADRLLLYLPLFHVFANFAGLIASAHAGCTVVLMSGFDARQSLELIARERVSIVMGVPTTYHDQIKALETTSIDLTSLRFCFAPGARHDTEAVERHMATAVNMYGMTETTSTTSVSRLSDPLERRSRTVGSPLPGSEVRIIDDAGVPVAADTVGEILVRGHPVTSGYYRDEGATKAAFDEDGWFRTGDLGSLATDGVLTFVGRKRDMIKVGGENVDPVEIELLINAHPDVDLSAVVGVPDDRLDEVVCAYVIPRPGTVVDPDDVLAVLRPRLAGFKLPRHVMVVDSFPLTATGKIQKAKLVAGFVAPESNASG
jgi:fatty-acyl-CoA synthase